VSLRSTILGSACALALGVLSVPALADGMMNFDGVLSGDYANFSADHGGSLNSWGGSGSAAFGFGSSNFAGEVDGGYHNLNGSGVNDDVWNIDGSVFWRANEGRIGAVVGYDSLSGGGSSGHVTNYGGFGEYYAGSSVTLGLKAGGFSASGFNGDYAGAAVTFYAMPNLAFTGGYDYTNFSHSTSENDWSIRGEWLISQTTPVSIYAGYDNSKISGVSSTISVWSVGIKLYCDPVPATLVERQRSGTAQWGTSFSPVAFSVF
jgi:hypothetical protein